MDTDTVEMDTMEMDTDEAEMLVQGKGQHCCSQGLLGDLRLKAQSEHLPDIVNIDLTWAIVVIHPCYEYGFISALIECLRILRNQNTIKCVAKGKTARPGKRTALR